MTIRRTLEGTAALLALGLLAACNHPASAAGQSPVPVKVRTVEARPGSAPTRYSGSLEPLTRVDMAFRVGGYVEELGMIATAGGRRALDKGDFVTKGTLLARIRSADYAQKVVTAGAMVTEARAQATLANTELERAKRLFDSKTIAKAELDARIARADTANAEVAGAVARASEAGIALSDTVIRAPMDGVILSRQIEVGTLVAPGQPALAVAETRSVKAVFGAPQALVEKLELGRPLEVLVGSEGPATKVDRALQARVTRIAPAADTNGRVFSVEAELPNPNGTLRPGSVVSVHVPDSAFASDALVVPLSAVVRSPRDARGFSVFVLGGRDNRGKVELRDVELGEVTGNAVTVSRGLALGQRVVTVGSMLLRDGSDAVVIR